MGNDRTMVRTWKPIVAGILELVSGIAWIVGAFAFVLLLLSRSFYLGDPDDPSTMTRFWIVLIIMLVPGVLSLIGGGAALNRRNRVVATVGAACSAPFGLGIAALILLARSKPEFPTNKTRTGK